VSGWADVIGDWRARLHSLPLNAWTLERFGLTPQKIRARVRHPTSGGVLCVSLPKAGTHLLERAVCLHPGLHRKLLPTVAPVTLRRWNGLDGLLGRMRPGEVVVGHLPYEERYATALAGSNVRALFVIRDPRDVVLSQVHYTTSFVRHRFHQAFAERSDLRDRIRLAVVGDDERGIPSIATRLDRYAGWLTTECHVVRFEDLVGSAGGGDDETQYRTVSSIYDYVSAASDERLIREVCDRLFSRDSPTFRRGAIGQWRDAFDADLTALFGRVVGDRLERFGYDA
jgi:sulfotransferase family protein